MLIKNRDNLLEISNVKLKKFRGLVLDFLEIALSSIKVPNLLKKTAEIDSFLKSDSFNAVFVIGFGKASGGMAEQLEKIIGPELIDDGLVIVPRGIKKGVEVKKIRIFEADHPIPSKSNTKFAELLEKFIRGIDKHDSLIIILISGGGSALLTLPSEGITLEDLQQLTDLLLKSGANIKEFNIVRKHVEQLKGGQLVKKLYPARTLCLLISDVGQYPPEFIASGPTFPDQSTYQDAITILKKYGLLEKAPMSIIEHFNKGVKGTISDTPKKDDEIFSNTKNIVIGNFKTALDAIFAHANQKGIITFIHPNFLEGEARDVGRWFIDFAKELSTTVPKERRPLLFIGANETTVTIKRNGRGGRCQELILGAMESLGSYDQAVMVAIGTDGIDGNSDAAGALIDNDSHSKARKMGLNVNQFLSNNDSYTFFQKLGHNLIFTGPTGTNVNDIILLLIN